MGIPVIASNLWLTFVLLLIGSVAIAAVDSVGNVPFMRAVRTRERPEMTMVYSTYSDASSVLPSSTVTRKR